MCSRCCLNQCVVHAAKALVASQGLACSEAQHTRPNQGMASAHASAPPLSYTLLASMESAIWCGSITRSFAIPTIMPAITLSPPPTHTHSPS
jgi:hypothetical protein